MRRLIALLRGNKPLALLLLTGGLVVLVAATALAVELTSRPAFCNTCHEMTPYYEAWAAGAHSSVDCIACHVDPGLAAQASHKLVAVQEVYIHFTGDPRFPGGAEVPDSRCVSCHDGEIDPPVPGFDHETHRAGKPCVTCHADVGHTVTAEALNAAGVLDPKAFAARDAAKTAEVGAGIANLEGHAEVTCSNCHDLAKTGCESCHSRPEEHPAAEQTCLTCHRTAEWKFTHPAPSAECTTCHERPSDHYVQTCVTCHETGASWKFTHPAPSAECATCHERPAGHSAMTCVTCHETGVSWKFTHPTSTSCASCHKAPASHYGTSCASCHSPSKAWSSAVFKHPASSSACLNCHSKPSGHYTSSCASCHKTGVSWKFTHPTSTSCASCHKAPASHYGTSCASCHSPSKAWSSATFAHPSIPGGEHTYRSFSCATCHPSGYSTYSCLKCHSSNSPDDDDDD